MRFDPTSALVNVVMAEKQLQTFLVKADLARRQGYVVSFEHTQDCGKQRATHDFVHVRVRLKMIPNREDLVSLGTEPALYEALELDVVERQERNCEIRYSPRSPCDKPC